MILISAFPQLQDNYSYIILSNKDAIIIDPAESSAILDYIKKENLSLKAILLTHHHSDHTGGVEKILRKKKVPVYSPNIKIQNSTKIVRDQEILELGFIRIKVIKTPGHTMDHVVYYSKENKILFSGDTLFRLGCGRVFEGTYKQMLTSLQKIFLLDNSTNVYCGHEYTKTNLNFLLSIFPKNQKLIAEEKKIDLQLKTLKSSIPFNLGNEKKLNPFLSPNLNILNKLKKDNNLSNLEIFSYLRDLKNNFQ